MCQRVSVYEASGFADPPQPNSSQSHTPSLEFTRPTLERLRGGRRSSCAGRGRPLPQDSLSAALQATPTAHIATSVLYGTDDGAAPRLCRGGSGHVIGKKSKVHLREI